MHRYLVPWFLLLTTAVAQEAGMPALKPLDVTLILHLVDDIDALSAKIGTAKDAAAALRSPVADDDAKRQLAEVDAALAERIDALKALRKHELERLPLHVADPVAWVKQEAGHAWDCKELRETLAALKTLERDSAKDAADSAKLPAWLATETERGSMLASYYVAVILRRQADDELNAAQAVLLRSQALARLDAIGKKPPLDFSYSGAGTSLLATSLHLSIRARLALHHGYVKIGDAQGAAKVRRDITDSFERLDRGFQDARSADGKSLVNDVRQDVDSIRK